MKFFFITRAFSPLANEKSLILEKTRQALLRRPDVEEVLSPHEADVLLIQEEFSYKDFRYIDVLLSDPIVSKYLAKVFTLNFDDCATGLLRGLYANIPKSRLNFKLHAVVPYTEYFNEQVFLPMPAVGAPVYLATWRGNSSSNRTRPKLVATLQHPDCKIELTDSWLNHSLSEKEEYVQLLLSGKFSLCPAGLAHSSFRIYESLALGRCPVIIADDYAAPMGPDWSEFALFYPESRLSGLHDFLKHHEPTFEQRGRKARQVWNDFFRAEILHDYYADSLISLVKASATGFSVEAELKRWRSNAFYWSNNWTLGQRVANRLVMYWQKLS